MGPKEPPPKRTQHRCDAVHRQSQQRHWAWPICKGGLVSPATTAKPESRAGTWLDDAPITHFLRLSLAGPLAGNSQRSSFVCVWGMGTCFRHCSRSEPPIAHIKERSTIASRSCSAVFLALLPPLRRHVDIWGLVRRGQAEGTDVRACSVQVVVLLIRKIIGPLSKHERQLRAGFPTE